MFAPPTASYIHGPVVIWPSYILALNNEPVIKSLLEMGFTFTDVTYAVNEYTKHMTDCW
jgi:hypothetical protein